MRQPDDKTRVIRHRHGLIALAVAACFAGNAQANPTGPAVVNGKASFATQGNTLTVTNTPGTIINWQGFSIAGSEITRFIQQSQASSVFNRVVGINPSAILGTLQSNGRVFLINPNGITIGSGAHIDVAGFVASTLNMSDGDFLSGRMRFTETPGAGSVVNQGTITTAAGGMVYLVGQDVQNSGIIRSPQGEILLAAGKSVELVDAGTPELRIQLTAPDGEALNLGQLIAEGGGIGMYGALVRHSGVAEANTAVVGENGKIVFRASQDVTLEAGSRIAANGPQGGSVTVQAETGTLLAAGSIEATGASEQGGTVQLLGHKVGLTGQAQVDVSGERGGGTVLVGGDYQGGNPEVQNAQRTYLGAGTRITADAGADGDGGKVIVWADGDTRFDGAISARGGAQSGNGGFVEVSGKENLNFYGHVDAGAPAGADGTILLDPRDITIVDSGGADDTAVSPGSPNGESVFFAEGGNSNFTISDETLEGLNGSIVLQAQRDINVNAGLELTKQEAGERVTLQAGQNIIINSPLTTNGAAIWLEADSPHSPSGADTKGKLEINAIVKSFVSDPATGGKITLLAGSTSNLGAQGGGFNLNADVNAGAGGIDVALTTNGSGQLNFFIGASGVAQFTSTDTGQLKSTGQLKIGEATTAGSDGLGTDDFTIKVNQLLIGSTAGGPVTLAADAGSSLVLTAGDGGILVDQHLSTAQSTSITTSGPLTISGGATLTTNGNSLSITAASISGVERIDRDGIAFACTGTGCPDPEVPVIHWDGEAGDLQWATPLNWSTNTVPGINDVVEMHLDTGVVVISGPVSIKSLIADVPIAISSTGSITLAEASQFTKSLTLSGTGSLLGIGDVAVSGNSGVLSWSGGTMGAGGQFTLGVGSTGTLSGTLTLDRFFHNSSALTLAGVTNISGTGSIENSGILTAASGTTNNINVGLTNPSNALISVLGTLTVGMPEVPRFSVNDGVISVGSGGTFSTNGNLLNNSATSSIIVDGGDFSTDSAAVTTVGGNLALSGALTAGKVVLSASGDVTLDAGSSITALSSDDTIVISGDDFINNAGATVLDPGAGRWLVYSTGPAGNTFGPIGDLLASANQAVWNASFSGNAPATIAGGNRYVFSTQPTLTFASTDAAKIYGQTADVSANYAVSGFVDASLYGGVFTQDTAANAFTGTPGVTSAGSVATAGVANSPYVIDIGAGTLSATTGYALAYSSSGTLTVAPAALSVTANSTAKTYGQTVIFDGSAFISSGLQNGETIGTVTLTSAGAAATAGVAGGPYAITPSAATGGSFDAGNYTISYNNDGTLTVNPAVIGLAGSRLYDGSTDFGAGAFGVINGVNGETLTLAGGTGTVPSATVSAGVQVLSPGSLALGNGSGLASNYTLAGGSHTGTILPDPGNFQWVAGSGGNWDLGSNWNQGVVPVAGAVVTIPDIGVPGLSENITYRSASGDSFLQSLTSFEGLTVTGGTLSLGATAADVSTIPQLTLAGGALGGSGTLHVAAMNLLAGGLLKGSGTIVGNVSNAAGTLAPGASPGILTIDGNYTQGAAGTLAVEIGGALPGTQYDQLVVTGNTSLDGTLDVALINGFVPTTGNTFTVIQGGGTVSGTFATTTMPAAPTMTASYLASAVTVTSGSLVNTDQLVAVQVDQTNNAPPANDVGFGSGPVITSGQVVTNAYVDTSGGQIALAPVESAQPGIYTNVTTGETTLVDADSMPDPGIYLSADQKTIVVVTWDQESGKLIVMTGSAEQFGSDVKSGAQVRKPGVCS